jgi:hypothetical protein
VGGYAPRVPEDSVRPRLTIAGADREMHVVGRRRRWKTVCAGGAHRAAVTGRSISPLGRTRGAIPA